VGGIECPGRFCGTSLNGTAVLIARLPLAAFHGPKSRGLIEAGFLRGALYAHYQRGNRFVRRIEWCIYGLRPH